MSGKTKWSRWLLGAGGALALATVITVTDPTLSQAASTVTDTVAATVPILEQRGWIGGSGSSATAVL